MALSILDGNQSATTLSTILSSGQHITAHTVVSLGTQAKTDILSAVSSGIAISGTVTANVVGKDANSTATPQIPVISYDEGIKAANVGYVVPVQVTNVGGQISEANPLPISGTVTIGSIPNGALTTRFGSITTANTAFATTAVTNASRKYLMIQNIASTVITAGIGFTPTTTQGIQLVAGATITYDGNYIPTGAVRILSSVTASNFTVLEA
jgi:hypothetical protein